MTYKTKRACLECGKPFYGSKDCYYCPVCARNKKTGYGRQNPYLHGLRYRVLWRTKSETLSGLCIQSTAGDR